MKNLTILASIMFFAFVFTGCNVDYNYSARYVYVNSTDKDIKIESYLYYIEDGPDSTFVIAPGKSHALSFMNEGSFLDPFVWQTGGNSGIVVCSNGEKQFTDIKREGGKLFLKSSYKVTKKRKRYHIYQYTFTDADFENAEPIEQ